MLLPLTLAFLFGLLLGSYVPFIPVSVILILFITAVVLTACERWTVRTVGQSLTLFGVVLGGVLYWNLFVRVIGESTLPQFATGRPVTLAGTIVDPVRHGPERTVLVLAVLDIADEAGRVPVLGRVRLTWRDADRDVYQGDRISLTARLRRPGGLMNPGGFDYAAYLERQGIDAVASVSGPGRITVVETATGRWPLHPLHLIDEWRSRIRKAALASLSDAAPGIVLGMIIGEADYVIPAVRDLFMATGTVHLLSISGSHLGLIALSSFLVIRTIARRLPARWLLALSLYVTPTRLAAVATAPLLIFYTLLAGAQVATVRSLVMILLFLWAVWLGRENILLWTLATAAWVILLADPRALFEISFQLSFVSVLAIALIVRQEAEDRVPAAPEGLASAWRDRVWRWGREYLWMTMGVTLATAPLVAYYFNQIAWLGVIGNLLVVPLAGFVLVPLGLVSAIWLLMTGSDVLPLAWLNQAVSDAVVTIVRALAAIPGAEWHVASPSLLAMALFYLFVIMVMRMKRPLWLRATLTSVVLLTPAWWVWSPRLSDGHDFHVTFLDVGQGDASVIELPDGQTVLIDGGAAYDTFDLGRAVVAPYLWDRGIRRIDHIIATHPQLDHVGGLATLIDKFEVGRYWSNGAVRDEPFYQRLTSALRVHQVAEGSVWADVVLIESKGCRLRVLNPPHANDAAPLLVAMSTSGSLLNNQSIVTRLDCGPHSVLFTADIEGPSIDRLRRTDASFNARIIKVPHHGARSSLDPRWIAEAKPDLAVISVGRTNPYGHPAPSVLAAYQHEHIPLLRTDEDGAIRIHASLSSPDFLVERARARILRRIPPGTFDGDAWRLEQVNLAKLWQQWTSS